MKVATAQYPIAPVSDWASYAERARRWVAEAAEAGADLLVFPEYFSMELASLFGEAVCRDLAAQLEALQGVHDDFVTLYAALAAEFDVVVVAGTFPVRTAERRYVNRCYVFDGAASPRWQDKLQMTRFENEHWLISPGESLAVFQTRVGTVGVNICYDSEFPLFARAQAEAGAQLIVVPSCTDSLAGYWRVRIGCQARALENQCFVVQSPTVGEAAWSEAVDVNVGAAAIYSPSDRGFPSDGVVAVGSLNEAGWVFAEIDLASVAEVRRDGQVLNYRDWTGQDDRTTVIRR